MACNVTVNARIRNVEIFGIPKLAGHFYEIYSIAIKNTWPFVSLSVHHLSSFLLHHCWQKNTCYFSAFSLFIFPEMLPSTMTTSSIGQLIPKKTSKSDLPARKCSRKFRQSATVQSAASRSAIETLLCKRFSVSFPF